MATTWGWKRAFTSVLLATGAIAQQTIPSIVPSNSSSLDPSSSYPRFYIQPFTPNQFPSFEIAPLGQYSHLSKAEFVQSNAKGQLVQTSATDASSIQTDDLVFISCDFADYASSNLNPGQLLSIMAAKQVGNYVIFYTQTANHCEPVGWSDNNLPSGMPVFSTLDPTIVSQILAKNLDRSTNAAAYFRPDLNSYTNSSIPGYNAGYPGGPTTAKAMVILYAITGVITTLFIGIIITGAVRAHRHPERYGPRRGDHSRGRQSRAKGMARALLDTIPIVKFGDQQRPEQPKATDVELVAGSPEAKSMSATVEPASQMESVGESSHGPVASASNADGSDESGSLGCSICTEDFQKGEEVRVLPCNHKFHPDCVDPWLLNVSGTCPLCRVDLRPPTTGDTVSPANDVPPLAASSSVNTSTIQNLRAVLNQSREERIDALRRLRLERRNRHTMTAPAGEDEGRGLTNRLTAIFRVRTRTHEGVGNTVPRSTEQNNGADNTRSIPSQ